MSAGINDQRAVSAMAECVDAVQLGLNTCPMPCLEPGALQGRGMLTKMRNLSALAEDPFQVG